MNENDVIILRASDMNMDDINRDAPLYQSTKDEDRKNLQPVAMQQPEEIDLVVRRAIAEPSPVTEFPAEEKNEVPKPVLLIDKNKLEKVYDKKTSATIVSNIKENVPLPKAVSKTLIKNKIIKEKPVTKSEVTESKVTKKPVSQKNDVFDNISIWIIKTFNI